MTRPLCERSLEQLWRLFPIFLTEPQPVWKKWYTDEVQILKSILPWRQVKRISHIGSTSVQTIWAKPIIDILVELSGDRETAKKALLQNGYLCMAEDDRRISFNKGYTEKGFAEKVYHLHLRYAGDNDELYFRDYLIAHPDTAKEYEKLKLALWKKHEYNRDSYTKQKTDFVLKYTEIAKRDYAFRY